MMMKQGKLRFLSARILCVIIGLIVVIGILSLLLLFDSFKERDVYKRQEMVSILHLWTSKM